jgi:hypothetical protein
MTTKQYLAALKRLGLSSHGKDTAEALGVTVRQLSRYASGDTAIPDMLERLLECLQKTSR